MSSFATLLRQSRVVNLPGIRTARTIDAYPTHQAIRTTTANQAIGDWGLKRPLPNQRTKNIAVSELDTQEHQTTFSSANRHSKVVSRWQEMGIPIQQPEQFATGTTRRSVRESSVQTRAQRDASRSTTASARRKARTRRANLLKGYQIGSDATQTKDFLAKAQDALLNLPAASGSPSSKIHSSAGLAYHPHGHLSLINTPEGPMEKQLTARVLSRSRYGSVQLGIGGIIASERTSMNGISQYKVGRDTTIPVHVASGQIDESGELKLSLSERRAISQGDQARQGDLRAFAAFNDDESLEMEDRQDSLRPPRLPRPRQRQKKSTATSALTEALKGFTDASASVKQQQQE